MTLLLGRQSGRLVPNSTARRPNGAVLYDGPSEFTGEPILCAVTGLWHPSNNEKTGDMLQMWVIRSDQRANEVLRQKRDEAICGDCKLRGHLENRRVCYVAMYGPTSVYDSYSRGDYDVVAPAVFEPRTSVRLGAYGDPAALPRSFWDALLPRLVHGWTGYTHQWAKPEYQWMRRFLMASVDSEAERDAAKALGWRTYRIANQPGAGEVMCPASEQAGRRTTCARCKLCNGERPRVKDISIPAHGYSSNAWEEMQGRRPPTPSRAAIAPQKGLMPLRPGLSGPVAAALSLRPTGGRPGSPPKKRAVDGKCPSCGGLVVEESYESRVAPDFTPRTVRRTTCVGGGRRAGCGWFDEPDDEEGEAVAGALKVGPARVEELLCGCGRRKRPIDERCAACAAAPAPAEEAPRPLIPPTPKMKRVERQVEDDYLVGVLRHWCVDRQKELSPGRELWGTERTATNVEHTDLRLRIDWPNLEWALMAGKLPPPLHDLLTRWGDEADDSVPGATVSPDPEPEEAPKDPDDLMLEALAEQKMQISKEISASSQIWVNTRLRIRLNWKTRAWHLLRGTVPVGFKHKLNQWGHQGRNEAESQWVGPKCQDCGLQAGDGDVGATVRARAAHAMAPICDPCLQRRQNTASAPTPAPANPTPATRCQGCGRDSHQTTIYFDRGDKRGVCDDCSKPTPAAPPAAPAEAVTCQKCGTTEGVRHYDGSAGPMDACEPCMRATLEEAKRVTVMFEAPTGVPADYPPNPSDAVGALGPANPMAMVALLAPIASNPDRADANFLHHVYETMQQASHASYRRWDAGLRRAWDGLLDALEERISTEGAA